MGKGWIPSTHTLVNVRILRKNYFIRMRFSFTHFLKKKLVDSAIQRILGGLYTSL